MAENDPSEDAYTPTMDPIHLHLLAKGGGLQLEVQLVKLGGEGVILCHLGGI